MALWGTKNAVGGLSYVGKKELTFPYIRPSIGWQSSGMILNAKAAHCLPRESVSFPDGMEGSIMLCSGQKKRSAMALTV